MLIVDHIFVLLLFVVLPTYGVFETRLYDARAEAGQHFNRIRFYRQTALLEWAFLAALAGAWITYGRPLETLGLVIPGGAGFWGGAALLMLFAGFLLRSWRSAKNATATDKDRQVEALGKLLRYLPRTESELRSFVGLSLTAGIVEEIVYRGFVLWYLGHFVPLWAAVAVSSIAFGLAHSYQGVNGALRCGLTGLAFALFYVVTGSIWLPIIAHALLDVATGAALYEILREQEATAKEQPTAATTRRYKAPPASG
jgi:membrane protease YdiL (CAAX protease family)